VGWGSLVHVLRDPDPFVQQHALGIVRNMTSGGAGNDVCVTQFELVPVWFRGWVICGTPAR
jgi:hypothetical protein